MYKLGTDISLTTCRAEGYVVVNHPSKKDFKGIDKEQYFDVEQSYHLSWPNGYYCPSSEHQKWMVEDSKSFNDLVEILNADYKAIASFADYKNCPPELENPNITDYLHLASDLIGYYGNHYFSS